MGIIEYDTQCESSHNQHLVLDHAHWFSSSSQEWIVSFVATKHMIRHEKIQHPLSNYRREHIGEKVVIDDNSNLSVLGCNDVTDDSTNFVYFLHVPRVGLNIIFITPHEQNNGIPNQWVVEEMNDGF